MSRASQAMWQEEFGLTDRVAPSFVRTKSEVELGEGGVPHAHQVARAFELFSLNGVLCDDNAPLVYFKAVRSLSASDAVELHKKFWNHGGAPLLVVILPREVQIYSSFERPGSETAYEGGARAGLVTNLERATAAVRRFIPSVESGEFFREHARSFHPDQRVDRALLNNLQAAREELRVTLSKRATEEVLDALLCRLVFTCYLFDRDIIDKEYLASHDLPPLPHLRDILAIKPRSRAKDALYRLFAQLAKDFNGDLFSDDLRAEAHSVTVGHMQVLKDFFSGTDVTTGQAALWPYDFGAIPVETVSAIYERFLTSSEKESGAFYTPRFLAELVLDMGLSDRESLLDIRVMDPSCGSGIFLVGLFNRMAEEWKQANPRARNERRARELMQILRSNLLGIDVNPTACRIAAFGLCLAYLDQLSPRDIQTLQEKGGALPRLIGRNETEGSTIVCGDFFELDDRLAGAFDLVVGNPPWGSSVSSGSRADIWCREHGLSVPDRQVAAAFMWKAPVYASRSGRVCFVLPHGTLFNHSKTAIRFQEDFTSAFGMEIVLNLTDYQRFLFREAGQPALVIAYNPTPPRDKHTTEYWAPKIDWKVLSAEVVAISEQDRHVVSLAAIRADLHKPDAPQIWKRLACATPRDRRLLDRLSDMPRLRERTRQVREKAEGRRWLIAEGFQPVGDSDDPKKAASIEVPPLFVEATSHGIDMILLQSDCIKQHQNIAVRGRSNKATEIFESPHVLVSKGFTSIAYCDFPVCFRHAIRGIVGPHDDTEELMFLAAYLSSPLARYIMFHMSSNWGVSRQEVHVEELLRIPFPPASGSAHRSLVSEVADIMRSAATRLQEPLVDRAVVISESQSRANACIFEYFDVSSQERILIEDTITITIPSFRPTRARKSIPAIERPSPKECEQYILQICEALNRWAPQASRNVQGASFSSARIGIAVIKLARGELDMGNCDASSDEALLHLFSHLSEAATQRVNTLELVRGVKVFRGNELYIVKPLARRYWTRTAALNDADEIASSILMHGVEAYA